MDVIIKFDLLYAIANNDKHQDLKDIALNLIIIYLKGQGKIINYSVMTINLKIKLIGPTQ